MYLTSMSYQVAWVMITFHLVSEWIKFMVAPAMNLSIQMVSHDFSLDIVDCGSGANNRLAIYSGDSDTAINCEQVENYDR